MNIRASHREDFKDIARIYAEGLDTGVASFETEIPDWNTWNEKFLPACRYVVETKDKLVVGWCALSAVSKREVYKGVAEVTIYIAEEARGQGVGKALLSHLIKSSEQEGFWTLQAGIFPKNQASLALHKQCGFRVIGIRERPAQRNGKWYDNVLMERRSKQTGIH
ncbi:GNAT family N-acetyltransferase [Aureitalea marina]|uniref:N-acetyltransferase n=1 Tax=Aureitalea marina TaxID=930804 RepID=A0A2S7KRK6_9FLAO|nr:GNAT family N-acetyltransferase [Aureitalea marina]PQB05262.1 N-acetyltransferase [Aureitalea marina]